MELQTIRPNIVQAIRAYRVSDLMQAATDAGQHFLYANLAPAQARQDIIDLIAQQFMLSVHTGKNFDALYDSLTDPLHKSGPQPGFIAHFADADAGTFICRFHEQWQPQRLLDGGKIAFLVHQSEIRCRNACCAP